MMRAMAGLLMLLATGAQAQTQMAGQMDPKNPTCPLNPDWSAYPAMKFTPEKKDGRTILFAEGRIDSDVVARLEAAIAKSKPIDEIVVRSPGGDAEAGNKAGLVVRKAGIPTRIPAGWACFSACNFLFMGGPIRAVEPGGLFIVHMFTFTGDGGVIAAEAQRGYKEAVGVIGDVEQGSALLASEDNDFLIRMGVSRKLLTEVMYRQKAVAGASGDTSTRRCLSQDELFRYNVANIR
ncbi:hypothetical protein [Sphingomonas sp. AP4-R1]|uniref:COG3904 family protein n=1 Tax=Sphingomonas sp. AP4-R1 TaxID=2735134 RepID=UPI0020A2FC8F|nr:hypothetical protein [Sphingomonas sp. AP4-R1]